MTTTLYIMCTVKHLCRIRHHVLYFDLYTARVLYSTLHEYCMICVVCLV